MVALGILTAFASEDVRAQALVQADANGNHSPEIQVTPNRGVGGERWRADLDPAAAAAIGPGATAAELATLAADFPPPAGGNAGWVFANGAALPGSLSIVHYDAVEDLPESPPVLANVWPDCVLTAAGGRDCFTVRYDNMVGGVQTNPVAPNVLRWVQFICTNSPAAGAAACPPAANSYVDPEPNDDNLPFYYTEPEHGIFSGAGNAPPLTFLDKPLRGFPLNRATVNWEAHLYLAEWNGVTPNPAMPGPNGVVTIRGGVEWGFCLECVAIHLPPSTYRRGGVDRDKPTTEIYGPDPDAPPPPACVVEELPRIPVWGLTALVLSAVAILLSLLNFWRLRAGEGRPENRD